MRHSTLLGIFSALFGLLIVLPAQADDLAYNDPAGQGTQDFPDNLALDFTVNSTITLTSLGVFNADGGTSFDGTETAYVAIFNNSDPTTPVAVVAFTPGTTYSTDGSLGYDLFQAITPVVLGPGSYAVDVVGLTTNGNLNMGSSSGPTLNTGGGALTFTGAAYDYNTSLDDPTTCYGCAAAPSPQNQQFDAGTFTYSMAEAPALIELILTMCLAGLALVASMRRRKNHQASQA